MATKGGHYCELHKRIVYHKAFEWFTSLPRKLGKEKYAEFYSKIKSLYEAEDNPIISLEAFEELCSEFSLQIGDLKDILIGAFP